MAARRVPQDPAALERLLDAQRLLCLGRQREGEGGLDANIQPSHSPSTSKLLFSSPKLSLACAASVRGQIGPATLPGLPPRPVAAPRAGKASGGRLQIPNFAIAFPSSLFRPNFLPGGRVCLRPSPADGGATLHHGLQAWHSPRRCPGSQAREGSGEIRRGRARCHVSTRQQVLMLMTHGVPTVNTTHR
jgi:hypothetical protein